MPDDEKIIRLEEEISNLHVTIEELNEVITGQWKEIDLLKRQIGRISDQVADLESQNPGFGTPTKPPHY